MKKLLLILLCSQTTLLFAQEGSFDSSFAGTGVVFKDYGTPWDDGNAVKVQPDGKILIAGYTYTNNISDLALSRYDALGNTDNSFGVNGSSIADVYQSQFDFAYDVDVLNSGTIIVGGKRFNGSYHDMLFSKFNSSGTLIASYMPNPGTADGIIYDVLVQPDQKILGAGLAYVNSHYQIALYRIDSLLSPDSHFGTLGKVITAVHGIEDYAAEATLQSDGKIVLVGTTNNGLEHNACVIRYNPDGTLDNTFGTNGITEVDFDPLYITEDYGQRVRILPDGKIVIAAIATTGNTNDNYDFGLARLDSTGHMDYTFGNQGIVTVDRGSIYDYTLGLAIQQDGKVIIGGYKGLSADIALLRFNTNGTPDNTFGTNGEFSYDFHGLDDNIFDLTMQSDGNILAVGTTNNGGAKDVFLAKIFASGNVGILEDLMNSNQVQFYPNPVLESINLQYTLSSEQLLTFELLNAEGKLLTTFTQNSPRKTGLNQEHFSLPKNITAGNYILRISDEMNRKSAAIRFVVGK